jgi:hypothetical protein
MRESPANFLIWISERQAVNPASILWIFRGMHGELELTFVGGKQLTLHERDLSDEGRALLLPSDEQLGRGESMHQPSLHFPR